MKKTITITDKGQTTIPVAMRRKLGLGGAGGVLQVHFNEHKGEVIISKAGTPAELSSRISSFVKPNTKPLTDVDEYYQAHRNHMQSSKES